MANILITGGSGFIGSHLIDALSTTHKIRVADIRPQQFTTVTDFLQIDLSKRLPKELCRDIDIVIHLAAKVNVEGSISNPLENQQSGEVVTLNLLETCKQNHIKLFIYASSTAVYGSQPFQDESCVCAPQNPYAVSKLASEAYIKVYSELFNLKSIIFRYFNVFGPRSNTGVISTFIQRALEEQDLIIYGDGSHIRDFTYIENIVQANLLAISSTRSFYGEVFNVGCGVPTTIKELADKISLLTNKQLKIDFKPAHYGEVLESCANINKIRDVLGYKVKTSLTDGLQKLLNK